MKIKKKGRNGWKTLYIYRTVAKTYNSNDKRLFELQLRGKPSSSGSLDPFHRGNQAK